MSRPYVKRSAVSICLMDFISFIRYEMFHIDFDYFPDYLLQKSTLFYFYFLDYYYIRLATVSSRIYESLKYYNFIYITVFWF